MQISIDTTMPPLIEQWCEKTGIDKNCVLDLNSENSITVCEEADSCQEEIHSVILKEESTICAGKEKIETQESYIGLDSKCL